MRKEEFRGNRRTGRLPVVSTELLTRGIAKVLPKDLAEQKLSGKKPLRLYWGIDPTGAQIHLGHAVPLRIMQAFVEAGHEVVFLVGSFTAMIGDPTDRDQMRQPLTREQVEQNFQTYKEQAAKVLDFSRVQIRYNHEWLDDLCFKDLLGLAGNFTVNQMLERDMFEKRLDAGKPITLTEFFYPLMVGYDSVVLDVDFELGGTDQEFNMLAGRTLQKAFGKREKCIITCKLLEGTDGRKMSKSYGNCVYLTDEANDMYGKILSIKDELIVTYMECCTSIPLAEIKAAEKAMKAGGNPKDFKMRLAREIVTLYHGADAAVKAEAQFQNVFAGGGVPDDMEEVTVKNDSLLADVIIGAKLVPSKSEYRRLLEQKGIHVNDVAVTTLDAKAEAGIVRVGKRKWLRIALS